MSEHDLHKFFSQVTEEMASEYERIVARATEDPGTAGDEGEENWATLFRDWLPPNYHVVTKGRLIAADGRMSPQIDLLVLKPFYPRKLLKKKVWLADGVAAAFECKLTLRPAHIKESYVRCKKFKDLVRRTNGTPESELRSPLIYGLLAHSHDWNSKKSKPVENVANSIDTALASVTHPSDQVDVICLSDVATWTSMAVSYYESSWNPAAQLANLFGGSWGPMTSVICAAIGSENQKAEFQPVGSMVSYVTQRLAWHDSTLRDLADYYRAANLWGAGSGPQRPWPQTVYSQEVRQQLAAKLTNGVAWSEWSAGFI